MESPIICWMISTTIGSGLKLFESSVWVCQLLIWTTCAFTLRFELDAISAHLFFGYLLGFQKLSADLIINNALLGKIWWEDHLQEH